MASTYDKFVAFSTDSAGLERILRFFQSVALILLSYPVLLTHALVTAGHPLAKHARIAISMRQLLDWLNVTRRALRTFRFLEFFKRSQTLYEDQRAKGIEDWLDVITASTLGMYGLLETATLVDVIRIDGLQAFGAERSLVLNLRAQMFWFAALYAAVLSSGIKLFRVLAYRAVLTSTADPSEKKKQSKAEKEAEEKKKQEERDAAKAEYKAKVSQHGIAMAAALLDLTLPTAALGYVKIYPGVVGIAMFITTILTSRGIWMRCAQQLEAKK